MKVPFDVDVGVIYILKRIESYIVERSEQYLFSVAFVLFDESFLPRRRYVLAVLCCDDFLIVSFGAFQQNQADFERQLLVLLQFGRVREVFRFLLTFNQVPGLNQLKLYFGDAAPLLPIALVQYQDGLFLVLSHLGFDASDQYLRFGSLDFFGFDSPYVTLDSSCTSIRFILCVAENQLLLPWITLTAGEDQN